MTENDYNCELLKKSIEIFLLNEENEKLKRLCEFLKSKNNKRNIVNNKRDLDILKKKILLKHPLCTIFLLDNHIEFSKDIDFEPDSYPFVISHINIYRKDNIEIVDYSLIYKSDFE